jgi:hypothetical protein
MAAISLETGAIIVNPDIYATVRRPNGSGDRHELNKRHLVRALGISQREWEDMIVLP